jgi:hypothetical protein
VTITGREALERQVTVRVPVTPALVVRLLLVRAIALVPVAFAALWAANRLGAAGYHQLILPDDLRVPLAVRILLEARDAALVVAIVWLGSEFIGGLAVRHAMIGRRSVPMAVVAALVGLVRRPATTLMTFLVGAVAVLPVAGVVILSSALLWSRLQALLADGVTVLVLVPATLVFVLVWGGGLVLVGVLVTWRSLLGALDIARVEPESSVAAMPARERRHAVG